MNKILIAAGGTGGHLFPAQQLAEILKETCDVMIAGHNLTSSPFFTKEQIAFAEIAASAPKRGRWFKFLILSVKGFCQSLALFYRYQPKIVVGFGSYHTFPLLLAAAILRKKIVLFEANCAVGKVNRLFLPFAEKLALQFPLEKPLSKQVFVPYFPWIKRKKEDVLQKQARAHFGLDPQLQTLLVFGGSQGAAFFNHIMPKVMSSEPLALKNLQVIHLTGKGGSVCYAGVRCCVKEFETQMHLAYAAADLVVCRSGAATIAELIEYKKPALLIPYPFSSENHQWKNGEFFSLLVKGGSLLAEKIATPEKIREEIELLLADLTQKKEALMHWQQGKTIDFLSLLKYTLD